MANKFNKGKKKSKGKRATFRTELRKNRGSRTRRTDWTRGFDEHGFEDEAPELTERISGKGDLTRMRTVQGVVVEEDGQGEQVVHIEVDRDLCREGRVLAVRGLVNTVRDSEGNLFNCAVRRLLKTIATDQRHVVAVGDHVLFRAVDGTDPPEGIIESVQPRKGSICRTSRGRRHIIVTNVDQLLIITSAAQPRLKPNLIDRMIIAAEKSGVEPIICINKIDLIDPADLQPLLGVYGRMGYETLLLSAETGFGVERLRRRLAGRESVVAGQSGVGKSSLLNAIYPDLCLRVSEVSTETEKGRHTTTTAELLPTEDDGFIVDTPGIRQFALWDVIPEELAGFFRDLRSYVSLCRFPDCTHTHEDGCAIKDAVADGRLDARRYESYCAMREEI